METRGSGYAIARSLHQTRLQLSTMIRNYFSDYANQNWIWKRNQPLNVQPISPNDPPSVEFAKHCLLILQEAEELARRYGEYQEFKGTGLQFFQERFLEAIEPNRERTVESKRGGSVQQSGESKETLDQALSIDLFNSLKDHLSAVAAIAKKMNVPEAKQVADLVANLGSISIQTLFSQSQERLTGNLTQLNQILSGLMGFYFNPKRPLAPQEPERKYEMPKELEFRILTAMPKDFKEFKPDSYLLIKEKGEWQVIYLDDIKRDYKVDWVDVAGLKKLLRKKSPEKFTSDDYQKIKEILSERWNPSVQQRSEWFLLVEPVRNLMRGSQKIYDFFERFVGDCKSRGVSLDPEQMKLIDQTAKALRASQLNREGYYQYLDEDDETPLSQSLKGMYNVVWGVNQLIRRYWENTGLGSQVTNQVNAAEIGLKMLDHYWKIQWPLLGGEFGVLYDQMINAFLIYGRQMVFPLLGQLARTTHEVEMENHLRYGVLSENLRPLLDNLETAFIERGLDVSSPLGVNKERKDELDSELKLSLMRVGEIKQQLILPRSILEHLEFYKLNSPLIDKPNTLFRSIVGTQLPLAVKLEDTVTLLLIEFVQLRRERRLPDAMLPALNRLEEHLLSDLPLEKKIGLLATLRPDDSLNDKLKKAIDEDKKRKKEWEEKSYLQKASHVAKAPWKVWQSATPPMPATELQIVMDAMIDINKKLEEKLQAPAKYKEAIVHHDLMRTEYAERMLRKEGLNELLRAVEVAKDNPAMNIRQKRKLVAILADLNNEERAKNLADAHSIAVQFVSNPVAIKNMIEKLPADIRHALAVETTLTGDIKDFDHAMIYANNQEWLRQDLENMLDRLEASQVLRLISKQDAKDELAAKQVNLLKLLLTGSVISKREVKGEVKDEPLTKDSVLNSLVMNYKQLATENTDQARQLMTKIGLFLGRLALADKEIAVTIFRGFPDAKNIIMDECLQRNKNLSLYYEAYANIFSYKFVNGKHERENRNYEDFLKANRFVVKDLHDAVYGDQKIEVTEQYNDPWKLCDLINEFNKKLSHGSDVEKRMKEFFSALVLCNDVSKVRERMVGMQLEAKGSKYVDYAELLTVPASYPFWEKVRDELIKKKNLPEQFSKIKQRLADLTAELNETARNQIMGEAKVFFNDQEKYLNSVVKTLPEKKDVVTQSKYLQQEMKNIEEAVDEKYKSWERKIAELRSQADLNSLREWVSEIIVILTGYLKERKGLIEQFSKIRQQKIELASDYVNKFRVIEMSLQGQDANYKTYAEQVIELAKQLDLHHQNIVNQELKEGVGQEVLKDNPKPPSPKQSPGRFGTVTHSVTKILNKLSGSPKLDTSEEAKTDVAAEPDDFKDRLTRIGDIIKALLNKLSSWVASPKQLSPQKEMKRSGRT